MPGGKGWFDQVEIGVPRVFAGNNLVGVFSLAVNTRYVTFTLAGLSNVTATLPPIAKYPMGQLLLVVRTDAVGGSAAAIAAFAGETIDGAASVAVPVSSGLCFVSHNGTEWFSSL